MGPRFRQSSPLLGAGGSVAASTDGLTSNRSKETKQQSAASGNLSSGAARGVHAAASLGQKKSYGKRRLSPPTGVLPLQRQQQQRERQDVPKVQQQQQGHPQRQERQQQVGGQQQQPQGRPGKQHEQRQLGWPQQQHLGKQQQQQLGRRGEESEGFKQQQQQRRDVNSFLLRETKRKKKQMRQDGELQQQRQAAPAGAEAGSLHTAGSQIRGEGEIKEKQQQRKEAGAATAAVTRTSAFGESEQQPHRRRDNAAAAAGAARSEATPKTGRGQQQQQRERPDVVAGDAAAAAAAKRRRTSRFTRRTAAAPGQRTGAAPGEMRAGGGGTGKITETVEDAEQSSEEEKEQDMTQQQQRNNTEGEEEEEEEESDADPYLLAEAEYLRTESRWVNRQRVLVLSSRGVSFLQRRLMEDFKKLLPHHKAEAKWEKKQTLRDIVELAQLRACNNVLFFESRKYDLLLHVAKLPHGPTAIFRVLNIHTLGEMKLTGNCLLHSRPLLLFDPVFDSETEPHWRLLKELFVQVFGTPRNHPKAKPFFDHAMGFFKFDGNKLWFRHYQIAPLVPGSTGDANKPERQTFVEIGPRCVFEAVKILDDAFGGKTIWSNRDFVPTRDVVALHRMQTATEYAARVTAKERREEKKEQMKGHEDPLSFENVFGGHVARNLGRPSKKHKS